MRPIHDSKNSLRCLSRRELLSRSGCGIGSLALGGLLASSGSLKAAPQSRAVTESPLAQRAPQFPAKVKRVIHLFMNGGPSQIDTFDPKPEVTALDGKPLPDSIKARLQPTQRNRVGVLFGTPFHFEQRGQSGLPVSDLFPRTAEHIDDLCVVRSMQGEIANHTPGLLLTNCGHSTLPRPSLGSWLLYGLGNESDELPGFVVLCPQGLPTAQSRNWTSAFLPGVYQGTHIDTEGSGKQLIPHLTRNDIRAGSQRAQVALTQFLNQRHSEARPGDERLESRIHSMELAFRMQTAGTDVFDLSQEPAHIREMYGETTHGRNLLIARRFAERGVRYIQCYHGGGQPWDNHSGIVPRIKQLARESDQPIAALLADLKQRGMLNDTLVIWGGEMGRTSTTQSGSMDPNRVGRDHHIDGYTIWLAGGGFKRGFAYGSTDEFGLAVAEESVSLHDLHATILYQMGFDHKQLTYRYSGRDFRLTDVHGRVVEDLFA
ncbi:MAG: DUF1501 domain-containing protein [Planctomycetaceae bacterium]|nr:DUF1501 domain-containing protein [Planctomycetales bacterium]MCB9927616.1 DUF1501 domain-containing protein [Planctomycetaceae bacterium]